MRVDLQVGGARRSVSIEPRGAGFSMSLDGRPFEVDVVRLGPGRYSLRLPASGAQHDVVVTPGRDAADLEVVVGGVTVPVRRRVAGRTGAAGRDAGGEGPQRLVAPMPGKVVRVLVGPGDEVAARQGVVVVEAMKMENELRASRAGVVREVLVVEGASVEAGAPLVVIG
jgi:biotin carboxyl carrier protein